MLGFSMPKILLLLFIIFIIWYGFKLLERSASNKVEKDKDKKSSSRDSNQAEDESKKDYTDADYTEIDEDNER